MMRKWRKLVALYVCLPIGAVLFIIGFWNGLIGVMITAAICVVSAAISLIA